ncbi:hypothetical protein ACFZCP_30630 [Streptomyces sp. NPDC007971]|uniref:hypothetical protein n=1 Tax=Streptomyces sp. NPDC007971 TaxID=3364799 RepID=UPI0036E1CF86
MWSAEFQPLVFRRTPKLIRQSDPEAYHLSFVVRGTGAGVRGEPGNGIKISTSGAGDRVHRTKDVAEGTGLSINLCMTNSTGAVCSPVLAVHARGPAVGAPHCNASTIGRAAAP